MVADYIPTEKIEDIVKELEKESEKYWQHYHDEDETQSQGIAIGLDKAIIKISKIIPPSKDGGF